MSAPWLKFYPSDWRADPALRMCSIAARGLWMEMLCVMHEATPRGSLLVNGLPVSERQLASLAGVSAKEVAALLAELEAAGVFSREDNGTIYSRRMRRDDEKAERDKVNGKGGGNPALKRGVNPPDKAQKPEAREQSSVPIGTDAPSASPIVASDLDRLWLEGKPALIALGVPPKQCGGIIGRWLKDASEDAGRVLAAINRAREQCPFDAIPYVTASLKTTNGTRTPWTDAEMERKRAEDAVLAKLLAEDNKHGHAG